VKKIFLKLIIFLFKRPCLPKTFIKDFELKLDLVENNLFNFKQNLGRIRFSFSKKTIKLISSGYI